ncbi:NADH-quinone oxidoreductase subunit M [Leptospira gomenensis]|uniref:NADH-quinone oxidoreductase subunit M n=1 Tax=Leptospira gomenensis TaxID=2484974 RepID=A0A5F1Y6Y1_9LEPT|nr:NADH-quinone oxidoreductase subunit M [Leptospira gomenensis]TGK28988.1 NADH-quinone oxidoreductase subunit M [Leptospira gomenensis]TGK32811.1 NADH-quinone oxidoreductase subunit M [Leptospira gomenensis]TGK40747.1 NADH-quinone oxidoreductase subunit M [Leptospira gomenensis]TGK68409.1 NADH-quinone oxidoreductase subunit M [Leptospira gomenensis]
MEFPPFILSIFLFLPLAGVPFLFLSNRVVWLRFVAGAFTFVPFLILVGLYFRYDPSNASLQFVDRVRDLVVSGNLRVDYHVGLDGFSLLLCGMSSLLFFLSTLATWSSITNRIREFYVYLMVVEMSVHGVFLSGNLVQFYIFWEAMVSPMVLMVGIWGEDQRVKAAIKYLIFSFTGSVLMLAGILILYFKTGTIVIEELSTGVLPEIPKNIRLFMFFAFVLAFAIKVPLFPVHTWMPDVHSQAPTVGSVDLSGILLKIGLYGFVRLAIPIFPEEMLEYRELLGGLAVAGILYGAVIAMAQENSKRVVAFSSLSHMSFCMLGILSFTEEGMAGGLIQMINHGFTAGMLFFMLGMLHERIGNNEIAKAGGLSKLLPVFSVFFAIAVFSSLGVPGTNGFIGEFLIILGSLKANFVYGALAATGVVFAAGYLLLFAKRMIFGEPTKHLVEVHDLSVKEWAILVPTVIMIFWIGIYPKPFLEVLKPSVKVALNSASLRVIQDREKKEKDLSERPFERKYTSYKTLGEDPDRYEERLKGSPSKFALPESIRKGKEVAPEEDEEARP